MNPTDRITSIPSLPNQGGLTNVPGIRKLWLIETRYVMGFIDPRMVPGALDNGWNLTNTSLQIAEDAVINAFTFPASWASYEQKPTNSIQGIVYSQSLTLEVPRDHPAVALLAMRLGGRKFVAIYQDGNGLYKMIGTPQQPVRFLSGFRASPNQYSFSLSGTTRHPAYFFTDPDLFLLDLQDFSFGFSYDFYS